MFNLFDKLRTKLSKPLLFGIYGALGCLLTAILFGEIFLYLTQLPPSLKTTGQSIVLLMDTSGSMQSDNRIGESKAAALDFVKRRDLLKDQIAVVNFGSTIETIVPLTSDLNNLTNAISGLTASGGTPMAQGIEAAISNLQATKT